MAGAAADPARSRGLPLPDRIKKTPFGGSQRRRGILLDSIPQRGICEDCPESTWVVQLSGRRFPGEEKRQTKKSAQPPAVRTNLIVHRLPVTAGAQVRFWRI